MSKTTDASLLISKKAHGAVYFTPEGISSAKKVLMSKQNPDGAAEDPTEKSTLEGN